MISSLEADLRPKPIGLVCGSLGTVLESSDVQRELLEPLYHDGSSTNGVLSISVIIDSALLL